MGFLTNPLGQKRVAGVIIRGPKSSLDVAQHLKTLNLTLASGRKKKCKFLNGFKVEVPIITMSFAKPPGGALVAFTAKY